VDRVADRLRAERAVRKEVHDPALRDLNARRPPYSNQPWLPMVGTTVPLPVTVIARACDVAELSQAARDERSA
jgi:hypothetical protein